MTWGRGGLMAGKGRSRAMRNDGRGASMTDTASEPMETWLIRQGLEGASQEEVLEGYCARLVKAGVPLMRLHVSQSAFHPQYGGLGFEWQRDREVTREKFAFTETPLADWVESPFYLILRTGRREYRERLTREGEPSRFPLLNSLIGAGATDYFASALVMEKRDPHLPMNPDAPPEGLLISWVTDRPEGFGKTDIERLRDSLPILGLVLKSASNRQMARDLLQVYLGRDAGRRVMSGELQRGSLQQIDAVICNFDLSGFTSLSERIPGHQMIALLNDYFAVAVAVIQEHGGHVLKFMGDGILAIFDLGDITRDATAALEAASKLRQRIAALNARREAEGLIATGFTLALHAGEVLYGNIGAENRLDFTVIGPAVNQTARIGELHKSVGQSVIVSEDVRRVIGPTRHDMVSLGRYMLRGVAAPKELFTVFETDARPA